MTNKRSLTKAELLKLVGDLHKQERQYRELVEGTSDIIVSVNPDGTLLYANFAAIKALGLAAQEYPGRSLFELIDPLDNQCTRAWFDDAAAAKVHHSSLENLHHDPASGKPLELLWNAHFVYTEDGKLRQVDMCARNITPYKQAEEALRESDERFRTLVEEAVDAIFLLSPSGKIIDVNQRACECLGYTRQELSSMTIEDVDPTATAQQYEELIWKSKKHGEPVTIETVHRCKDGRTFPVELHGSLLTISGEPVMLGFARGIAERKRAEEERLNLERQVQHSQKLESLGVLAGGIAHDFNNLLTGVLGNADIALHRLPASSEIRQYLEDIQAAAENAAELATQMLAYSGQGAVIAEPVNLSQLVAEMTHLLGSSVAKKVSISLCLEPDLPSVTADIAQLRQVVMNLITNAAEAIGDRDGTVTVTTSTQHCSADYLESTYVDDALPEGVYVCLEVADTGCGMTPETAAKIFDPFFTTKSNGRGLGLAALLGIVRGHHGAIKVESMIGVGTTVSVVLPQTDQPAVSLHHPDVAEHPWQGSGTILLVDDEKMVRDAAANMLEVLGFNLLVASNGSEAVDVFRQHADEVSLVLLDMKMPRMNGDEAFEEMRRIMPTTRAILCSGYTEAHATRQFAGKGLAGFIQKPYRLETLEKTLRKALGRGKT